MRHATCSAPARELLSVVVMLASYGGRRVEWRGYGLLADTPQSPEASDVETIKALKAVNPALKAGFVGAKVAVELRTSLETSRAIDFVAGNEFDFTIKEITEGRDWASVDGISYRNAAGVVIHNKDRATLEDMDSLPFVTEVYKRDLRIEDYNCGEEHRDISAVPGVRRP